MKVFENIRKWKDEIYATAHADPSSYWKFEEELIRVIKELVPIRGNKALTRRYYENTLRYTTHANDYYNQMREQELNGIKVTNWEYKPLIGECVLPEEMLHSALLQVIQDDKYSFGYLYWLLGSEYNRQVGYAFYDDIVIPDDVIEYAIKFDVDELRAEYSNAGDIIDRLDYLNIRLVDSKSFVPSSSSEILEKLKSTFERVVTDMIALTERRLKSIESLHTQKKNIVRQVPFIEDSVGLIESGDENYLVYYDLFKCPIDISQYPFSTPVGSYKIVRTQRGLEDANPILMEALRNVYKEIGLCDTENAKDIINESKELLRTLFKIYNERSVEIAKGDIDAIITRAKWWSMNTVRCIRSAFDNDVLPPPAQYLSNGVSDTTRISAWEKCLFFQKVMSEFATMAPILFLYASNGNPYKNVHNTIPFNYYGSDYLERIKAAEALTFKNEEDRIATSFVENYGHLMKYLEQRLMVLDGKPINNRDTVLERKCIINDIVAMANDYLQHLRENGISKSSDFKYAFELWNWYIGKITDIIVHSRLSLNSCLLTPSANLSDDEMVAINNTGRQYVGFKELFNNESVRMQKSFMDMFFTLRDSEKTSVNQAQIIGLPKETIEDFNSERDKFMTLILKNDVKDKLMEYLEEHVKGNQGVAAFIYLEAARCCHYLQRPPYGLVKKVFGNIGSKANYNKYVGKQDPQYNKELSVIMDYIKAL